MDFHAESNRHSYAGRKADPTWRQAILSIVNPTGKRVVDIGCGGGIYSKAWVEMGASSVIGVDFSEVMLKDASENCRTMPEVRFIRRDATATGLEDRSADVVFARALIHHLRDLEAFFAEANRLLAPGGICIIQDRTLEDVRMPASPNHFRGYFFEQFPRLMEKEQKRRPEDLTVRKMMASHGWQRIHAIPLWETRRVYEEWSGLEKDLLARKGRSLLYLLTDEELQKLVTHIQGQVAGCEQIVEQDRWTIWIGEKGCGTLE